MSENDARCDGVHNHNCPTRQAWAHWCDHTPMPTPETPSPRRVDDLWDAVDAEVDNICACDDYRTHDPEWHGPLCLTQFLRAALQAVRP